MVLSSTMLFASSRRLYPEDVKDDMMIIIICYDILVRVRNRIKANNFYISHILIHSCCIYTTSTNMFLPKGIIFTFDSRIQKNNRKKYL